jgi:hypothetical protein
MLIDYRFVVYNEVDVDTQSLAILIHCPLGGNNIRRF